MMLSPAFWLPKLKLPEYTPGPVRHGKAAAATVSERTSLFDTKQVSSLFETKQETAFFEEQNTSLCTD